MGADAGDGHIAHCAIEVRGENLDPFLRCGRAAALVSLRWRTDGEEMPVGSDGVTHTDVFNAEPVGVGMDFDLSRVIERELF